MDVQDDFNNLTNRLERGIVAGRVQSPVILLFFIIGLPWNALVIGIILKKKLFTRPSVMLLLNLATVHFLVCLLVMPFPVVLGILAGSFSVEDFPAYNKVCQSGVLFILFQLVSINTVAMLSVDRVIYLKKPLTYERIITPRRMLLVIAFTWTASTIISLLPVWKVGQVGYVGQIATCNVFFRSQGTPSNMIFPYYVIALVGLCALGTLVQLAGSMCIIYITRKYLMARALRLMRVHSKMESSGFTERLQLVEVFVAIFTVSLSTALPSFVLIIALPITGVTPSIYPIIPISYISLLSKSVLHPIMEASMTHEVRETISEICKSSFAHIRRCCNSCGNCTAGTSAA